MRYLPTILIAFLLLTGIAAHAVDTPIEGTPIELSDVEAFINDVADALLRVAGVIAVGYMIYGGIKMVMSKGDSTAFGEGKKILINAIIGTAVIFAVGIIINTIASFGDNPAGILN